MCPLLYILPCDYHPSPLVSNLDKAVCFSQRAKTLRKGMNSIILSPAMGK